jgi:transposase
MLGNQDRWQEDLFVAGPMSALIPDDHILKRVDKVLDLRWLRSEVENLYCARNGRPSIDPEAAVRLMLAGFFEGIVHDRKLMRQAQVNLAIRWFAGYKLHENLPHHSSLTRIRQRWGAERFLKIFQRTVRACIDAGLVDGETVHVDATLIRANVSWASLSTEHAEKVLKENQERAKSETQDKNEPPKRGRPRKQAKKLKKLSKTDPEATLTTSSHDFHLQPSYKQHTTVDDQAGVVVDVAVTTGEANEGQQLMQQLERVEEATGRHVETVTADAGYAHSRNYVVLEERKTKAVIPPQRQHKKPKHIPLVRFKYDGKHQIVRCPGGKVLTRRGYHQKMGGYLYRSHAQDCCGCRLRARCFSASVKARRVFIRDGYEALLRARRARARWDLETQRQYQRHRWLVEGRHGEAKTQHGLSRAVRWGLENVAIQVYLTAAVMNLKRLATALSLFLRFLQRSDDLSRRKSIPLEDFSIITAILGYLPLRCS